MGMIWLRIKMWISKHPYLFIFIISFIAIFVLGSIECYGIKSFCRMCEDPSNCKDNEKGNELPSILFAGFFDWLLFGSCIGLLCCIYMRYKNRNIESYGFTPLNTEIGISQSSIQTDNQMKQEKDEEE